MNLQTLQSMLNKGNTDKTKEVVVILDNKEYTILDTSSGATSLYLVVERKKGLAVEIKSTEEPTSKKLSDIDKRPVIPVKIDEDMEVETKSKKKK